MKELIGYIVSIWTLTWAKLVKLHYSLFNKTHEVLGRYDRSNGYALCLLQGIFVINFAENWKIDTQEQNLKSQHFVNHQFQRSAVINQTWLEENIEKHKAL